METGYLVGSFSNSSWRDFYLENVKTLALNDPRTHEQSSIKRLNDEDFGENGTKSNVVILHRNQGKSLGTTSYAEVGDKRARGGAIITTDLNTEKDSLLEENSSYNFNSDEESVQFINSKEKIKSVYKAIKKKNIDLRPRNILFTGDIAEMSDFMDQVSRTRKVKIKNGSRALEKLISNVDLIVANFEKNSGYNKEGVFFMGLGNALKIPVVSVDSNRVLYPPLTGLAKKTFTGENRLENLYDFIQNPKKFDLTPETLTQIKIAKKMSKENLFYNPSKTSTTNECKNIYFSGSSNEINYLKENLNSSKVIQSYFNNSTDLVVAKFNRDVYENFETLKSLYNAYQNKVPVLLLIENETIDRKIARLSRRPLAGTGMLEPAKEYLNNLKSQHINDEALVYYNIMEKFNN